MVIDGDGRTTISVCGHEFAIRATPSENDPAGGNGFIQELEGAKEKIGFDCVVKVFRCVEKRTRYCRFVEEADFMRENGADPEFQKFIVPFADSHTPDYEKVENRSDIAWIAMPKCETWDLSKRHQLPEILHALSQILESISCFHKHGYAHRDIKIQNILRTSDGRWVLSDYGLIFSDSRKSLTHSGNCVCSYGGPPELERRVKEGNFGIFQHSDIYLFGKLCWQMITKEKYMFPGPFVSSGYILGLLIDRFSEFECCCEPLYKIMEGTIKDDWTKRLSLDSIKSYLKTQELYLEESEIDCRKIENQSFLCHLKLSTLESDCSVWSTPSKIEEAFNCLPRKHEIVIRDETFALGDDESAISLTFPDVPLVRRFSDPLTFELAINDGRPKILICVRKVMQEDKTFVLTLDDPPPFVTRFNLMDFNRPNQSGSFYLTSKWVVEIKY